MNPHPEPRRGIPGPGDGPLAGLRVLDVATLFAGPLIATLMADFGADVVKVEHPRGDTVRSFGWQKNGVSLWWALMSRNKRCVTLDLNQSQGQEILKRLAAGADVLIENFRPGTLERWGLGPDVLQAINPRLIVVRVTGFGQTGPYKDRPGFGTLAEAMSGFAHITGEPDGPPTLPPLALADSVCALFGVMAAMFALYHRDARRIWNTKRAKPKSKGTKEESKSPTSNLDPAHDTTTESTGSGKGQIIDLSIFEPFFWILGPQALVYDQLGTVQERTGNRAPFTAPRNTYQAKDGRWLGMSASSQSIAERVMRLVGREDLVKEPWFQNHTGRVAHQDELDEIIGGWIGERDGEEVIRAFEEFQAAIAPIYSIADIFLDPQYRARETITTVDDPRLGPTKIQNVVPRLSETPGRIRHLGPDLGAHNREVFVDELGFAEADLVAWKSEGTI